MAADAGSVRPFVGRSETRETLRRQWEEARAGRAGVTLLLGGSGVGKTTLAGEVAREIRGSGGTVLFGRALATDDPPPFSLLRAALGGGRDEASGATSDASSSVPVGSETWLLAALEGTGGGGTWRDRVFAEIAERVRTFTRRGPVALVLDDLHRADDSSLAAVKFLTEQLSSEPFWVLGTSRLFASLSETGRSRLERFEASTGARTVPLRPMTSDEVADYLRLYEPHRAFSPDEVARQFSASGGNPRMLDQLAHHEPVAGPMAAAARTVELSSIDPSDLKLLDVASVLGPEFPVSYLRRASGEPDDARFEEAVRHLVEAGWLMHLPGELLAFPEDRLREQAYGRLPETRRRTLHWSVGETLEGMGGVGVSTTYALARHFYLGRVRGKAVKYNSRAAEIADRAQAPDVARDHLARALESLRDMGPPNLEEEAELVQELSRISEELGLLPEAERLLREFLSQEKTKTRLSAARRASLEILLSRILADRGDMPAASELAKKVLDTPQVADQTLLQVGAHHQLGMAYYYTGRYADAVTQHSEELRLARKLSNPRVALRAQVWRLAAMAMMGPTAEAVAEAREVTVARDRLNSARESAQAHLFLGDLLSDARCTREQRREALDQYAEAIRYAEKSQDPRRVGWALYRIAELRRETGERDVATAKVEEAIEILGRVGDQVGLALATKVRGQIAMDQGAFERASVDLNQANHLLQGLDRMLEEIEVELRLAQLAVARGDRAEARRLVAELEQRKLPTARPDLVEEYQRLRHDIEGGSAAGAT